MTMLEVEQQIGGKQPTTANILTSSANERFDMKIIMIAEEGTKKTRQTPY